jgi:quercetin dioxygenase-like cupin family protein
VSEPSVQVATELVYENEAVRVWIMELAAGEESQLHRHTLDYLFVYAAPSRIELRVPGEPPKLFEFGAGYVQYVSIGDGVVHQIANVADLPHQHVVVELKQSTHSAQSGDNGRKALQLRGSRDDA